VSFRFLISLTAAVPTGTALAQAQKEVVDLFGNDRAAAKTVVQKTALAQKLLEVGKQSQDDPAGRYVLLVMARELAIEASDFQTVMAAIAELEADYQTDPLEMKVRAITILSDHPQSSVAYALLFSLALQRYSRL
jgi:hypothetical protein